MQNAVQRSVAPLFGVLLCVPALGQVQPKVGPTGPQQTPGSASPQPALTPPGVPQSGSSATGRRTLFPPTSSFQNEILATGFDLPTTLEFLPDGRMLVGEIAGIVKVLPPPYTTPDPTPFLDLDIDIAGYAGLQQGIFDIALDPSFASNRFYYEIGRAHV